MVGELLLGSALVVGGLLSLTLFLYEMDKFKIQEWGFNWLNRSLAVLLTLSLLLLFYFFYLPDFNVYYVFSKVASDTPLVYRFSAVWVGQEGVFLVWAWALSISSLFYSERVGFQGNFERRVINIVTLLCVFFVVLAVMMTPFKTTLNALEDETAESGVTLATALLSLESNGYYTPDKGFIQGQGMSPILMSPWMALHPPILFIAYALAAIPFGICFVHLLTIDGEWEQGSRQWARLSWILLSSGLIIGSFWAYEELSYGGYWTWDPIETASLIPWFALTIFLHGSYEYRRKGTFRIITPSVGVLTTVLIVYGTFITKSGLIESSHAYEKSIITPLLASAIIISALTLIAGALRLYFKEKKVKRDWKPLVSTTNIFYLSLILFTLLLAVLMWGITYPLLAKLISDKTVSIGKAFYNNKGYPFVAGLMLLSGFCLLLWAMKKASALTVSLGVLGISLIGYLIKPLGNKFVDTYIPIGIFVVFSVLLRMKKEISSKDKIKAIKKSSGLILHLGLAVLLIGVVTSGSLQIGKDLIYPYPEGINTIKEAGEGYSLKLLNLLVFQDSKGNWVQSVNVTVLKSGAEVGDLTLTMVNDRRYGRRPMVSILRGFSSDLYAVYYGVSGGHEEGGTVLPINVKINPFVSLVWIGSILVVISSVVIFVIEAIYSKS
jgi:cytochrome c-type biogenesis protein CcmF